MATNFCLRTSQKSGLATVFVRVRKKNSNIDFKVSSNIEVDIEKWNSANSSTAAMKRFRASSEGAIMFDKLDEIERQINARLNNSSTITPEIAREIVDEVIYKDIRELEKKERELLPMGEEYLGKMTLKKYIAMYISQIKSGARATYKGTNFAPHTISAINVAVHKFEDFQASVFHEYDFSEMDMNFYRSFTAYLKSVDYNINSIGKVIKTIKTILTCAEEDGYTIHHAYKTKAFKAPRIETDAIYLTESELKAFQKVNLKHKAEGYQQARDIFMIGVWTAQRISDYNNLSESNFFDHITYEKNDKGKIVEKKKKFLKIKQKKTGKTVIIPCSPALCKIIDKYPNGLPHLEDQVINRYIKDIGQLAKINQMVEITTTKGGALTRKEFPKYELIKSHTARRTGATLMYLSGMDVFDICKITGHSDIKTLEKYIKASDLETIKEISTKYDYFN